MQSRLTALATIALAAILTAYHAGIYAAVIVAFALSALLTPVSLRGMCRANTIDAELNLNTILTGAIMGFKRVILPLKMFATRFRNIQLQGTNKVEVPYYPIAGAPSKDFSYADGYVFDDDSNLDKREIVINRRKYQTLTVTGEELARFPQLDALQLGTLKGEKLAYDVVQDILSCVTAANFPQVAFTGASSTFDSDDVIDIRGLCNGNTSGLGSVADGVTVSGSATVTSATANFQFSDVGSPISGTGIPASTTILAFTSATAVVLSADATASGTGVTFTITRPQIPWPEQNRGLMVTPDYDTHLFKDSDIKLAYAFGSDSVIKQGILPQLLGFAYASTPAIPTNGENLVGLVSFMSAIAAAFSPIPPPPGARMRMLAYEIVDDAETNIAIEYREFGDPQADKDYRVIESNYGFGPLEKNALKRIKSA